MKIGLVGKPNVGKSTFFASATLAKVDIANYPFCTIEPNVGVAFIAARLDCPCKELRQKLQKDGRLGPIDENDPRKGSICQPRTGSCTAFKRLVPCYLVDVAGLVPGASEGKGRGNAFLADLSNCDALIQVVDAAATTDIEGNPSSPATDVNVAAQSIQQEIDFLSLELDNWILGLLEDSWSRGVRRVQSEGEKGILNFLHDKLSGLGSSLILVTRGYEQFKHQYDDSTPPWDWSREILQLLAQNLRRELFPIHIAANKADLAIDGVLDLVNANGIVVACMADMELGLRRASAAGMIDYQIGSNEFVIADDSNLSTKQLDALNKMQAKLTAAGSTGVAKVIDEVLFEELNHIVVYPVQDEGQWTDGDGKILPDAFVVPQGITAKPLAYKVHSDLGDGFIKGVDGRTRRAVGADYELMNGDVLKIHSR
ncbi:MAG TPA: TGS domain-containing protein [Candidatus Poseidoniaceae archaeon]|nr:MAG TPA: TGS domain-containing protein [Candidatus Poseidoniales archaeon]HII45055.1 TGS domain-containing protein [Candidatus Poseidoniaceae archaeon]|tara:strand:- start:1292 stop:2572 length:1281 start_codon:yes stop_codon:yes gene_type:complete